MVRMDIKRFKPLEYQATEAINTLCTNLFFAGGDIRRIMITSCRPQEGKSFVSMNLMRSLAGLGMRVVLVDADIRASAIQGSFGVQITVPDGGRYMGMTHYLAGRCSMNDILAETNIPNAWMILSGENVTKSLPLLNTPRLTELLDTLAENFDVVLVDAPPVGTIIDAARIASVCDGTLFVVQSGVVSHQELQESILQIEKTGSPILGYVLNQYDEHKYGGKYYYHKSGYYHYGNGYGSKFAAEQNRPSSKKPAFQFPWAKKSAAKRAPKAAEAPEKPAAKPARPTLAARPVKGTQSAQPARARRNETAHD